jgi:hypothetical protein
VAATCDSFSNVDDHGGFWLSVCIMLGFVGRIAVMVV